MRSNTRSLTKKSDYTDNDYAPKTTKITKEEELDSDFEDSGITLNDTKISISTIKNNDYKNKYEQSLVHIAYLENLISKLSQKQDENWLKRIEKIEITQEKLLERVEILETRPEAKEIKIPLPGNNAVHNKK